MSQELKRDGIPKLQNRYERRNREGKSRMLDELCEDYGYERKYAIKLLKGRLPLPSGRVRPGPERRYDVIEPSGVVSGNSVTAENAGVVRFNRVPISNGAMDAIPVVE